MWICHEQPTVTLYNMETARKTDLNLLIHVSVERYQLKDSGAWLLQQQV